jgi:peptide/nickel transport system substrate-binding protein
MPTGSAALGMTFDSLAPPANFPNMLNSIKSGSHNVNLGATYSSNPYLVFNTVSPNNNKALAKAQIRQALSYGMERSQFQKVLGGPIINPTLTHILPDGIDGSQDVPKGYNPYPFDPAKAKSMLAAAGYTASNPLQIKYLYRSDSQGSTSLFNNVTTQLNALGSVKVIGVPTNQSDFYAKYLYVPSSASNPSPAYKGTWDIAAAGWGPDWYGNSALTFFNPLYSSPGGFPANGGSNFGYFASPTVNNLISQALSQPTETQADTFWAQADQQVMKEAAVYPITSVLQLAEHAPYVHNAVFMTQWQNFDPTNVWLSAPGSS